MFPDVPKHKLINDVTTRWNSTYDMIQRVCKQQLAISGVLLQCRDLMHLEMLSNEWRILEDVLQGQNCYTAHFRRTISCSRAFN